MPGTELLDTLVRLAALGTSGISIFAIFWIGWLLRMPTTNKDVERLRALRFFMVICVLIAFISAGSGWWSARIDAHSFESLKKWKQEHEKEYVIVGIVQKDDGLDPGDVTISTYYPPLVPGGRGEIASLYVGRNLNGKLPSLSFHCPGYRDEGCNLDLKAGPATNVIDIGTIVMHKFPR